MFSAIRVCVILVLVNVIANSRGLEQKRWSPAMLTSFYQSRELHFVDAFVCNSQDAVKLIESSHSLDETIFWRVLKNWPTDEIRDQRVGVFFDSSCRHNQIMLEAGLMLNKNTRDVKNGKYIVDRSTTCDRNSKKSWFDVVYGWLIWYPSGQIDGLEDKTNLTENLSFFSDLVITSGSDFYLVTKFSKSAPVRKTFIGSWEEKPNLLTIDFPLITPNLHNSPIVGSIYAVQDIYNTSNISAQMLDRNFKHGWDSGNRFFYELFLGISDLYNFSIEIKKAFDWGQKVNGTWTGIIRQLELGISDLSFTPMLPFSERLEQSFAAPSVQLYWFVLVFKQPRALGTYKALILELGGAVWAAVAVFLLVGATVQRLTLAHGHKEHATFEVGFFQSLAIFTDQGLTIVLPKTASTRIATLATLMMGMLVSIYYSSATMTALLSEAPPTIRTLDDFIKSDVKMNVLNASYNTRKTERWKVFRPNLLERVEKRHKVLEIDEGLEVIRKGQAFTGEYYILFEGIEKTFKDDDKCALTVLPTQVIYTGMRFVRKDTKHLLEMVSRGLIKSHERGLVKKGRDDWIPGPPSCFRTGASFIHVKLESVSVAFGTLLAGMVLSTIFLTLELSLEKKTRRQKSRKPRSRNN